MLLGGRDDNIDLLCDLLHLETMWELGPKIVYAFAWGILGRIAAVPPKVMRAADPASKYVITVVRIFFIKRPTQLPVRGQHGSDGERPRRSRRYVTSMRRLLLIQEAGDAGQ